MSAAKKVLANIPHSASTIGTSATYRVKNPKALKNISILPISCARRVILRQPHFSADELHGLAFRLSVLGTNGAITSILVAPDQYHNGQVSSLNYIDPHFRQRSMIDFPLNPYKIDDCFLGINHLQIKEEDMSMDDIKHLLSGISELATACNTMKKSPVITVSNGLISDGGLALCMGRYVVATENTRFCISTPSKGLAFDPVGYSYILNRLGKDYRQPAAKYTRALASILALTGYTANGSEMVSIGLATHFASWGVEIGLLEETLGLIQPYEAQEKWAKDRAKYRPKSPSTMSSRQPRTPSPSPLPQNRYFDAAVANALDALSEGNAARIDFAAAFHAQDLRLSAEPDNSIVDFAATFAEILEQDSLEGIIDGLAQAKSSPNVDKDFKSAAELLYNGIQKQSPLSLLVTQRLLVKGRESDEKLGTCMERERKVQQMMLNGRDFDAWSRAHKKGGKVVWRHESVSEVTKQEVDDILEE